MATTTNMRRIRLSLEMRGFVLRRSEFDAMADSLGPLETAIHAWPPAFRSPIVRLGVTAAYRPRSDEYHVRTRLFLPRRLLMTGEHDTVVLPAYERCLGKLVHKLDWCRHVESMPPHDRRGTGQEAATDGTQGPVSPDQHAKLRHAHNAGDSIAFRNELDRHIDLIRERVGRWVRRYSGVASTDLDIDATGDVTSLDVLVEEVLLTAFARYDGKPVPMRMEDWLVGLIDPAMRSYLTHPEEELDAIGFARTLRELADQPRRPETGGEEFDGDDRGREADLFRRPR